jgi:hypothetical protein
MKRAIVLGNIELIDGLIGCENPTENHIIESLPLHSTEEDVAFFASHFIIEELCSSGIEFFDF